MTDTFTGISLGWGVQSMTLVVMTTLGDLPRVDGAVHADTTYESTLVYGYAKYWTPSLQNRGIREDLYSRLHKSTRRQGRKVASPMYSALEDCSEYSCRKDNKRMKPVFCFTETFGEMIR